MASPSLPELLAAADPATRVAALLEIDAVDATAEVIVALIACLAGPQKAVQRRAADACQRLAAAGVPIREAVVETLEAAAPRARWGAAYALARLDEDPLLAVEAALEAMGGDDGDVRWAAAEIVVRAGRRHGPHIAARLLEVLRAGSAPQRKMALYCLRDLDARGAEVLAGATAAAFDGDEGVALAALSALARLWPESGEARVAALALLRAENPRPQRAAASALGRIAPGDAEVDRALAEAAESGDESLRRAAEQAIRQRGA